MPDVAVARRVAEHVETRLSVEVEARLRVAALTKPLKLDGCANALDEFGDGLFDVAVSAPGQDRTSLSVRNASRSATRIKTWLGLGVQKTMNTIRVPIEACSGRFGLPEPMRLEAHAGPIPQTEASGVYRRQTVEHKRDFN
jgi:hypothetical protein